MPKIRIHYFSDDAPRLKMTDKGDWIDLYCAETMELHAGDFALVPLGVSMQLPAGYEARTAPRSSTVKRWGILQANSVGVIVPKDVSVICFDDTPETTGGIVGLTTVAQNPATMGRAAAENLLGILGGHSNLCQKAIFPPALIERESVAPLN